MNIFHFLFLRETKYIRLSPHQCQGCWECVAVCPEAVFIKMDRTRHPHVHVRNPDACTGCKKCVRVCPNAAIEYTYVPKSSQIPRQHLPGDKYGK
jgi:2-oxoglutarate ferredoxin oxidoreductase subunit delta